VSAANAPGFKFGSAHGAKFVAAHNPEEATHHGTDVSVLVDTVKEDFTFTNGGRGGGLATNDDPHIAPQGALLAVSRLGSPPQRR